MDVGVFPPEKESRLMSRRIDLLELVSITFGKDRAVHQSELEGVEFELAVISREP